MRAMDRGGGDELDKAGIAAGPKSSVIGTLCAPLLLQESGDAFGIE